MTIGSAATNVEVISESEIDASTTASAAGPDQVVVKDANGPSAGGPSFTYVAPPPPTVTSIDPTSGTTAGGTAVVIKGAGFVAPATVTIGSAATNVEVISESEIDARTAASAAGADEVVVKDANGPSAGGPSFTYVAPPGGQPPAPLLVLNPLIGQGVLGTATSAVAAPTLAVTGNLAPVSGSVLVELAGTSSFIPLTGVRQVPFGTVIEATHGRVLVTTATSHGGTQTGEFFGGKFILLQSRNGSVVAELIGGNFSVCPTARERSHVARATAASASGKHVVRKLWANAHGSFSTRGAYAAGAVQGTEWLTEDLCEGTLIRVTRDKVEVTNLVTHHRKLVKVGHKYLAKAP